MGNRLVNRWARTHPGQAAVIVLIQFLGGKSRPDELGYDVIRELHEVPGTVWDVVGDKHQASLPVLARGSFVGNHLIDDRIQLGGCIHRDAADVQIGQDIIPHHCCQ